MGRIETNTKRTMDLPNDVFIQFFIIIFLFRLESKTFGGVRV